MPHEVVVMSVSETIWGTLKMVVIDVFIKIALGTVVLLFGISWLLSL
jgi:hypothetical protein